MSAGFYWDERCFWHGGGNYAGMMPVGGTVQPMIGGLPESPESKRRLVNLLRVSGLWEELATDTAPAATWDDLRRVHPERYLRAFKAASDKGGGELGLRAPFGPGGFEIASLSAGLAKRAVADVLSGAVRRSYALSRPPGHHCLPETPNGFCLLANIAIAVEAARAAGPLRRVAVLDWDVHHGNGTEAIYLSDPDLLAISLHQERNYPLDTGGAEVRGEGKGLGANLNIPLPAGTGHEGYLEAMERIVGPALRSFEPELIIVACGFDAALNDPLGRMLATAGTFEAMTGQVMGWADDLCDGRLVLVHEGGYSETYVPFCGHKVLEVLTGTERRVDDPFEPTFSKRQPGPEMARFISGWIAELAQSLGQS